MTILNKVERVVYPECVCCNGDFEELDSDGICGTCKAWDEEESE